MLPLRPDPKREPIHVLVAISTECRVGRPLQRHQIVPLDLTVGAFTRPASPTAALP
jgi:hypothetical protein